MHTIRRMLTAMALAMIGTVAAGNVALDVALSNTNAVAKTRQTAYLKVSLTGTQPGSEEQRPPVNVALVIDESGSMKGAKIEKTMEAAIRALGRLGPKDVVSVVSYDSTVNVLVPAKRMVDGDAAIRGLKRLNAGGETALYAGVSKAMGEVKKYLDAGRVNRLVLISDGQANVGPSSAGELKALGRILGKDGISVSTIGLGLDYNEDIMTELAAASDGNHAFARNADALTTVFASEFDDLLSVVAQNVTVTIECAPGVTPVKLLGREAEIVGQTVSTILNQVRGGREKYILLEVELPVGTVGETRPVADVTASFTDLVAKAPETLSASAQVTYVKSEKEMNEALDKAVMVSVVSQQGNMYNDQAVDLIDAGQVEKAQAVLTANASFLNDKAGELQSPMLEEQGEANMRQNTLLQKKAQVQEVRKLMRASQYQSFVQDVPMPSAAVKTSDKAKALKVGTKKKKGKKGEAEASAAPSSSTQSSSEKVSK